MAARKDYSGQKINHLTLLGYAHSGGAAYGALWKALCDCGTVRLVAIKNVMAGRVKTCGKCEFHHKLLSRPRDGRSTVSAGEHKLFQRYLRKAMNRGDEWRLTSVQFRDLIKRSCALCGSPPKNKLKGSRLIHSYVERIDSGQMYTPENTFPSCKECARIKGDVHLESLLRHIQRIVDNSTPGNPIDSAEPAVPP